MRLSTSAAVVLSLLAGSSSVLGTALPPAPGSISARSTKDANAIARRETGSLYLGALSKRLMGSTMGSDLVSREPTAEDDYLTLRDSEDSLDARNPTMGHIAWQVVKIITKVIHKEVHEGKAHRKDFADNFIAKARHEYPRYNWLIVHTEHLTHFQGHQNSDWGYAHTEFDVEIGKVLSYKVYWFGVGDVTLEGYGGINWAYGGHVKHRSHDGKHLTFLKP